MVGMDYTRPIEAVIPGTTGKVLGVLARTEVELPILRVAALAQVSRHRASVVVAHLTELGIVSRREVAGASLVRLERESVAAAALAALADVRTSALDRLARLAGSINPSPLSLSVFGSFARGMADAESDLDVLAIRADTVGPDDPSWLDTFGAWQAGARKIVGNVVHVLDVSSTELRDPKGQPMWRDIASEAVTLAGIAPERVLSARKTAAVFTAPPAST
jgi:predicted nucleotidyltransferase